MEKEGNYMKMIIWEGGKPVGGEGEGMCVCLL